MALQTINNGELMSVIRGKINTNGTLVELLENKVHTIGAVPSTTKYPSEKAVSEYASKIYASSSIPQSKSGDLIFHQNANQVGGGTKGKIKFNQSGTLSEIIPDRSVCDCRTAAAFASSNPVLLAGEIAVESDTGKQKVGNGSSNYKELTYLAGGGGSVDPTPGAGGITYGGNAQNAWDIQYQQGWIKYPNGMIMQWGLSALPINVNGNFDQVIVLPIAFNKKRIYSHGVLEEGAELWKDKQILVHPRGIGNSSLRFVVNGGLDAGALYELRWMAIGF